MDALTQDRARRRRRGASVQLMENTRSGWMSRHHGVSLDYVAARPSAYEHKKLIQLVTG